MMKIMIMLPMIMNKKLNPDTVFKINDLLDLLSEELIISPNNSIPMIFNCNLETAQDLFTYESAKRGLHFYIKDSIQLNIIPDLVYGTFFLQFPYMIYNGRRSGKTYKYSSIKAIVNQLKMLSI